MAHKKAGGSTQLGRDSAAQRLGVKIFGGQKARAGEIIIRQRGSHYRAGDGVRRAGDDTLYAASTGVVKFAAKKIKRFSGVLKKAVFVSVEK
ncbi:MAG: 50S ribosomal protein L27 [bacterium]|nr:50S ribosomal protein L27 [bacterium]MDZ4347568.1 50S ribosomal protein L27 [Candidatus Binatia bacterium]